MTTTFLPHPVPRHLSHSQAETLGDCSLKYYLGRVLRVPEAPNMAAIGGKGTHLGTEMIDRWGISEESFRRWLTWQHLPVVDSSQTESPGPDQSGIARARAQRVDEAIAATAAAYEDCERVVRDLELPGPEWKMTHVPDGARRLWEVCFTEEIEHESEHAPEEFRDPDTWRVFGSKSKAYPDKENRAWWNDHGPLFLLRWINFRLTSGWELPLLDDDPDQPAIEIDCSGMVGDIEIKGFIDRIMLDPRKAPRVLDIKGLDIRTPIATPTGWTTMGEVQVGDEVFGANGKPVRVTTKSDVKELRCYRVNFDDGTSIICDEEHLWETTTGRGKNQETSAKGIQEIARRLRPRPEAQRDQKIRMPDPVQLPEADLPIDPYLLGIWLGDGAAASGKFTKPAEYQIQDVLRERGHDVYRATCPSLEGKCPLWMVRDLTTKLRVHGLQNNKHIPANYLRGSVQQRLDLLRGLMDSDGTWNKIRKQVTFCSVDKQLSMHVREIALSLGERAAIFEVNTHGFGKQVTAYNVSWSPRNFNPFLSPMRQEPVVFGRENGFSSRRLITSVEEVPSTPTVCIAVDAEDHLFLAGEQMVPTHNTNSRLPTKSAQLGLYSVRLAGMGFPRPLKGNYWWSRSGDLGPDISLSSFSEEEFAWQFRGLKAIRDSGFFTPNVKSITCSYCGVKRFCEGQNGELAHLVPKPWSLSQSN